MILYVLQTEGCRSQRKGRTATVDLPRARVALWEANRRHCQQTGSCRPVYVLHGYERGRLVETVRA